jgi:hypothetical protein
MQCRSPMSSRVCVAPQPGSPLPHRDQPRRPNARSRLLCNGSSARSVVELHAVTEPGRNDLELTDALAPLARAQDRDRVAMRILSRSPTASTVATMRFRTFALLRALETLQLGREPDVEGVCPWWASPPPDTSLDVKIPL